MFTGIVEELGAIISIDKTLAGTRMTILASAVMGDLKIGDSISVNGACLTVVNKNEHNFSVEVSPETLSVTTLGQFICRRAAESGTRDEAQRASRRASRGWSRRRRRRFAIANRMGTPSCSRSKPRRRFCDTVS
jgi:hypothetical protein